MAQHVDSVLYTKGSDSVKQQVEEDLKKIEPTEEVAKAAIKNNKGKKLNEEGEQTNKDTEGDD